MATQAAHFNNVYKPENGIGLSRYPVFNISIIFSVSSTKESGKP